MGKNFGSYLKKKKKIGLIKIFLGLIKKIKKKKNKKNKKKLDLINWGP
jgi:hypothetical protein